MATTTVNKLGNFVGESVTVQGWLYNRRSSGKLRFLILRDGSGLVQCIAFKGNFSEDEFAKFDDLTQESSLRITGKVKAEARAPGGFEMDVESMDVVHIAEEYPIGKKEHGPDFLLNHRHLWLRSRRPWAVLRIRSKFCKAVRDFFEEKDFTLIDAPIFTPNACEGTSTLFETDYFGSKAYLSQSGQLYSEAAAMAFGKVYCFGPTFRAEKSKTRRHLTEFWMIEPEMAYANLEDVMDLAEQFLEYTVGRVLKECKTEFEVLERDTSSLEKVKGPFPRITYDEAHKILKEKGSQMAYGDDLGAPEETLLGEHFSQPVFVHRWPAEVKAFYMKRDPENDKLALGVDCIAPEGYGELIGGAQREDDLETLRKRIQDHGLKEEDFDWFLDLRKYGTVPHGGFGLGLERTISWICGLEHVRETAGFPRMMQRLRP